MSIKDENKVICDDDIESGQCSDDEIREIKKERRVKKHKRKDKSRKCRKRKHSNSSCGSRSSSEFFNPYNVNPGKFNVKAECVDTVEIPDQQNQVTDVTSDNIISETFNNLNTIPSSNLEASLPITNNGDLQESNVKHFVEEVNELEGIKRRESEYRIDITGIDTVTSDLFHYLLDLGISLQLVTDLLQVYSKVEDEDEEEDSTFNREDNKNEEDNDNYEEEMINEIPIIEQVQHMEQSCYSPEHANKVIEPYKPQTVSYSSAHDANTTTKSLIDPLSIPEVSPRDARLTQSKTFLQTKPNPNVKATEIEANTPVQKPELSPVMSKEWEATVCNVVKAYLRLYLDHKDINKDEYKSILKRAVTKIISSGEKKLEVDKISKFLHSYVLMVQKSRITNINN